MENLREKKERRRQGERRKSFLVKNYYIMRAQHQNGANVSVTFLNDNLLWKKKNCERYAILLFFLVM